MTPPQLLKQVQPGEFVGEYVAPVGVADTKVPVLDIYEGELPDAAKAELDGSNVRVYEFMPVSGGEQGDVIDSEPKPYATAALGDAEEEDGRIGAPLTFVVGSPEASSHGDVPNPVIEGGSRFGRLLEVLTREDRVDHVDMEPGNTNLSPEQAKRLGFSAVEGEPDVLRLELPKKHKPAAAA